MDGRRVGRGDCSSGLPVSSRFPAGFPPGHGDGAGTSWASESAEEEEEVQAAGCVV